MFGLIAYEEIYGHEDKYIFIDVRSPKEAREEPMVGSINIPVLLDDERDVVGTLYVRESTEAAKEQGIEFISKRLPEIFKQIQEIYNNRNGKELVIFCARGGMRSGSLQSLLNSLKINCYKLQGGYKFYRKFIMKKIKDFSEETNFIVLYGNTGVGKTEMLYKLEQRGYDILDLEGCANHRGSILGGVGLGDCNTQKRFDALVYDKLRYRKSNLVFIEGESKRIGRILIPDPLFEKMYEGAKIRITASPEVRADRLVKDYTSCENVNQQLLEALSVLTRHISEERVEHYKNLVSKGDYTTVALELMEKYYDPMYGNSAKKRKFRTELNIDDVDNELYKLEDIYKEILAELSKESKEDVHEQ